jgi:hypothetical protein
MGNFIIKDQWENQGQDGRNFPEEHIMDRRNKMLEETSRRQRRMDTPSEEGQGPEGAVAL